MVGKKAFMKTIEILLVIILTTIFVLTIMPLQSSKSIETKQAILINLEEDAAFRELATSSSSCLNSGYVQSDTFVRRYLDENYDYLLCFDAKASSLPSKQVLIDTLYFAGNMTETQDKVIRLYYWTIE